MMWTSTANIFMGLVTSSLLTFLLVNYFGIMTRQLCLMDGERRQSGEAGKRADNEQDKKPGQETLGRNTCSGDFTNDIIYKTNSHPLPFVNLTLGDTENGICQGKDAKNCIPQFQSVKRSFKYSTPTKTVNCLVHKSMSTIFMTLSCFLHNPLKFLYYGNDLLDYEHWQARGDNEENCAHYYSTHGFNSIEEGQLDHGVNSNDGYQYAMVVRDPLERFLSGYIHFCYKGHIVDCTRYCNSCGANLTCFLEKELGKVFDVLGGLDEIDLMTNHLIPQNWQCELKDHFGKYTFLRYNSNSSAFFDQELGPYLTSRNTSTDALVYIRRRLTSARTKHSTSNLDVKTFLEKRIRESPYLMQLILRLFYYDYKIFGFEMPKTERV